MWLKLAGRACPCASVVLKLVLVRLIDDVGGLIFETAICLLSPLFFSVASIRSLWKCFAETKSWKP